MNDERKPFSERHGYTQPKLPQRESLDNAVRNGLWNAFYQVFCLHRRFYHPVFEKIFVNFTKKPRDEYSYHYSNNEGIVKDIFLSKKWNRVFDLIEFIIERHNSQLFVELCNKALAQENSVYKIVDGLVTEIASGQEIATIEFALQTAYVPAKKHLEKALILFSNRENPDYANSIKESISAVESIAKEITGKEKPLNALTQQLQLHPNFKNALDELYNWTSQDGIRHGKSGKSPETDQATARFMLVTCSAFVNYIIAGNSQT